MITELKYKWLSGSYYYDEKDNKYHGMINDIPYKITFEGANHVDVKRAFRESVDGYIDFCKQIGKDPFLHQAKERKIRKLKIDIHIDWSEASLKEIKKDIEALERLGVNHIEIKNYCDDLVKFEAYQVREETEEEYQERLKELEKEEENAIKKELKLLKMLQEKYQTNEPKCKCHKTVQEQLKELEKDYTNRLHEIVGKWPSDEKFEDLMKMLNEDNK